MDLGAHLGALGHPWEGIKGQKKAFQNKLDKKFDLGSIWGGFGEGFRGVGGAFGRVSGSFWDDFGRVWGALDALGRILGVSWVSWAYLVRLGGFCGGFWVAFLAFPCFSCLP